MKQSCHTTLNKADATATVVLTRFSILYQRMARAIKYLKILFHIATIATLSFIVTQTPMRPTIVKKIIRFLPDLKHLLIWTNIHGLEEEGQRYFITNKCRKINCYITKNKSLFEDTRYFDGIIFNLQDVSAGPHNIPRLRSTNQKFIFAANDSADNYPVCNSVYDNIFNWTWSYRADSIIRNKFFSIHNVHYDGPEDDYRWLKNMKPIDEVFKSQLVTKNKAAAIFLDKCESRSKREVFLENLNFELAKYNLSVDIYGKCGVECSRSSMNACYWKLRKIYHFYMAMEDSLAEDYVTDSVVYGYRYNAVPIVYGQANYERYLPPHSYLNALELGEKELARSIHNLMRHKEQYFKYFNWRNHYVIKATPMLNGCALCETLNNPAWLVQKGSYSEFRKWWNPEYENRCAFYTRFL
ncbi:hypothetical protein O3G_MSEX001209 [Manduca sexta]|uniref:Fucosyltransferase n=1 Tax=Manduca sexta TaxID=7130 RepID=A0A921YJF8_MANSE|nr:hypothetical protein O3G_MSEX001209 [Manduca sexta]